MDLVFDRRAIARPHPFDDAGIHRAAIQTGANDVMRLLIGMGNPAWHLLRMHGGIAHHREYRDRIEVTGLLFQHRKIDTATINTRWRTGFQAPLRQLQFLQPRRQRDCRRIASPSRSVVTQADVDLPVKESPGGQYHCIGLKTDTRLSYRTNNTLPFDDQIIYRLLEQPQIGLIFQARTDGLLV